MINPLEPLASIALKEKGVHEDGSTNAGPGIKKYQADTDLDGQGWPWCCAFVDWCIHQFIQQYPNVLSVDQKTRPVTASVFDFVDWAEQTAQLVFTPEEIPPYAVQRGDIVAFKFSHIGIVTGPASGDGRSFPTIEGNTNVAGARDGGQVATKQRVFESVKAFIRLAVRAQPADASATPSGPQTGEPGGPVKNRLIPDEAIKLILDQEGLDQPWAWPGGESGITLGRGYDLGCETGSELERDWGPFLCADDITRLRRSVGLRGMQAKAMAAEYRDIEIDRDAADYVFYSATLPKYCDETRSTFPGMETLDPRIQGALVSLVFNRGPNLRKDPNDPLDRRREMRQVHDDILAKNLAPLPDLFLSMRRLWEGKGLDGLIKRREAEAALIQEALADQATAPPPIT